MAKYNTKAELLQKLRSYKTNPDDDTIRFKEIIKDTLLNCPELLFVLNEKDLESELFDEDGNYVEDGEVDRYFGDNAPIRPYLFIPDVQTDMKSYVCYQVSFDNQNANRRSSGVNKIEKKAIITFTIFCYGAVNTDKNTGIPRHDLIASIIREKFNWTNLFGTQTHLSMTDESTTDGNYVVRKLIFKNVSLNSIVTTKDGETHVINTRDDVEEFVNG